MCRLLAGLHSVSKLSVTAPAPENRLRPSQQSSPTPTSSSLAGHHQHLQQQNPMQQQQCDAGQLGEQATVSKPYRAMRQAASPAWAVRPEDEGSHSLCTDTSMDAADGTLQQQRASAALPEIAAIRQEQHAVMYAGHVVDGVGVQDSLQVWMASVDPTWRVPKIVALSRLHGVLVGAWYNKACLGWVTVSCTGVLRRWRMFEVPYCAWSVHVRGSGCGPEAHHTYSRVCIVLTG